MYNTIFMPRIKRKKIELNEESFTDLCQEIYNETCELKAKAISAYNKQFMEAEDVNEIAMIGKITTEYLKIAENLIEKKLSIVRIQKDILFKNKDGNNNATSSLKLDEQDKKVFFDAMKEYQNKNNVSFDIKDKK